MIGRMLTHYEIVGKLGAGGMGEVYRAQDTRLGRRVAVKVLPEVFAQDSERIARFEREANAGPAGRSNPGMPGNPANANLSHSPTMMSMAATHQGMILGTAAYMSPEQAKGFEVDVRSEVFTFGCIFYEMFSGRQTFVGD